MELSHKHTSDKVHNDSNAEISAIKSIYHSYHKWRAQSYWIVWTASVSRISPEVAWKQSVVAGTGLGMKFHSKTRLGLRLSAAAQACGRRMRAQAASQWFQLLSVPIWILHPLPSTIPTITIFPVRILLRLNLNMLILVFVNTQSICNLYALWRYMHIHTWHKKQQYLYK